MAIWTYDSLVSAVQNGVESFDQEFVAQVPNHIALAEWRLTRDLDNVGLWGIVTATIAQSVSFITRTTAMISPRSISYFHQATPTVRRQLLHRTTEFINDYWPQRTSVATPKYYALFDDDNFLMAPCAVTTIVCEIIYNGKPPELSATNQANWFTNQAPEALFFGAMVEANLFLKNYEASKLWEQRYQEAINKLQNQGRRERRDNQRWPTNQADGGNNIKEVPRTRDS